ncbi:OLC1v1027465C1 [Oldenlandia corymbosa var. corymbosa]|uniref:OLC1v1027465C1 n=1 Tax=Oldenlandia corymbosa var. corymbosa TaxID=529605 RepID=A0AAV1C9J6_OLDCO|nr:OLC1v1027465C1 [Oldenlandia corymbosa var. corymbosa]
MKVKIIRGIKQLFAPNGRTDVEEDSGTNSGLDLREEYANAFRTESYNVFWERVLELSKGKYATHTTVGSTTASRLPSYRLFVDSLLDPDQSTIARILSLTRIPHPATQTLLTEYFSETANASFLCSRLLRDVDRTRIKYKALKATLDSLQIGQIQPVNNVPVLPARLSEFSKSYNPFMLSNSTSERIQTVQTDCSDLLKRLESSRDKIQAKSQLINRLKSGSAVFLVALTASLTIVVVTHALAVLVAAPCVVAASLELISSKNLAKWSAQLDSAAKGTYILMRDLDTISRLVSRLSDELEHFHAIIRFWLGKGGSRVQAGGEVARQLKMNDVSLSDQLDELEEHLYLCFMTINRARNLVLKEIQNHPAGQSPST